MQPVLVRMAVPDDAESILKLITEFAEFDGRPQRVKINLESVRALLNSHLPPVRFVLAEADGVPAGFASFYPTFSTAAGESRLCLEDLYVREAWRRRGVGKLLMRRVAQVAIETGCSSIEWLVSSENAVGLSFYESIGAPVRSKTRLCRLQTNEMSALAASMG